MFRNWNGAAMAQRAEGYVENARHMWATLGRVILDRDGIFVSRIPGETRVICSGSDLAALRSAVENEHDRRIVVEDVYQFGSTTPGLTQMVMPLMYAPATGIRMRPEDTRIHRVSTVAKLQAAETMIISSFPFAHLSVYEAGKILGPKLLDSSALSIWTVGATAVPDAACLSFSTDRLVGI